MLRVKTSVVCLQIQLSVDWSRSFFRLNRQIFSLVRNAG